MDIETSPNRLIHEKSPYLLQHAYNPVDWYPWGNAAFDKAANEDKPVFLSIGYSTCHWCHVMEHESFEDEETAAILNKHFVCIKVDREERPDVDAVYMSACVGLTGHGGWPLTILMTPDQRPFYTATYLPKRGFGDRLGLDDLLNRIALLWRENRKSLLDAAEGVTEYLNGQTQPSLDDAQHPDELIHSGADLLQNGFDARYGGFGAAPKFPSPHNLLFLMRYGKIYGNNDAVTMAEQTLLGMFRGGIFDHIGGGFSRYSTDGRWLVPHFEKMLYDNALLTYTYLTAFEQTSKVLYLRVAERTIDYVLRELTHPDGGFLCGQDADSDGVEGKYYVFTPKEIEQVIGKAGAAQFCAWFDITPNGNFEGKSIPNLINNDKYAQVNEDIEALCKPLYEYRINRTHLHKDDKILTSWNALMIVALAKAYRVTGKQEYLTCAQRAQDFIEQKLTGKDGRLMVRWRDGDAAGQGLLDDYAFYAWALLELYDTGYETYYLARADRIAREVAQHFSDEQGGGFFLNADDAQALISRPKEVYDGAIPSGNSVAAAVFERLSLLTASDYWRRQSEQQLRFLCGSITAYPAGYCFALYSFLHFLHKPPTLVCAAANDSVTQSVASFIKKQGLYDMGVIIKTQENAQMLAEIAPYTVEYPLPEQGARYYLCKDGTCLAPADRLDEIQIK